MVVEYTLPVVLHILGVDRSDKGTAYAAGSLVIARVSWDASRRGLVTVWGSLSFVVVVEYTLPVVLHILQVDRSDKGTGYAAGSCVIARVSWDASRRGLVMVWGSLSFVVAVEYTLPVVLHILRVDSNDKATGYAAGSRVVAHLSWEASRRIGKNNICVGCVAMHPTHTAHSTRTSHYLCLTIFSNFAY